MTQFSEELINKITKYFKEKHNQVIDRDTANEYLRSFAKLYLAFNRPNGKKSDYYKSL
jgi:hypothetical protein